MANCGKCGAQVADGVSFCPTCGAPQGAAAGSAAPAGSAAKPGGMDPNIAAALAYIWIVAIIWLVMEPFNKDRFIKFHAIQSLGLSVVAFAGWVIFLMIPFLGWVAAMLWPLAIFAAWIICVINAFQMKWFKLPLIGDFAMKQVGGEAPQA